MDVRTANDLLHLSKEEPFDMPIIRFHFLFIVLFFSLSEAGCKHPNVRLKESLSIENEPSEWFFQQRSYPDSFFDVPAYRLSLIKVGNSDNQYRSQLSSGWNASWDLEGPTNIGGRINCVAIHPSNPNIMFAGNSTGGIFKTINGGSNWFPVFDSQPWLAISCIVFQPGNPTIMYAGTGDKNISGYPFIGDGIYKSTDGGNTWMHLGLSNEYIVSKIVIDPSNVNNIYAATMGLPFYKNSDRGVYKSTDGGVTWSQSLFVNDSTGAIDLLINPLNTQILYATSWNRIRNNHQTLVYGPDAGIYKTINGGTTWTKLINGLPTTDLSRIGITISGSNPNKLWAVFTDNTIDLQGIYATTDGGVSWNPINTPGPGIMGGFGWYFGNITVNPVNDNELWLCAVDLYHTTDGGVTWSGSFQTHSDNHDIQNVFANIWILATDGGIYKTIDGGANWNDIDLIPNNQFYRITYNPHQPGEYAGGVQDNGTNVGNAAVINNWQQVFGADGFQIRYHPTNPNIYYTEIQNGELFVTTDGGANFNGATNGIDPNDRRSWDMPYILNTNNPNELFTGTYRIYKNATGATTNWVAVSPDLTDGNIFGSRFHVITAIDQSTVNSNYLMAGTSDGNVWISTNSGVNWNIISTTLPDRYVTSVHFSPNAQNLAYVTHSGYKDGEFIPHIHKTTDNGISWTDISGNLPQMAVNDLQTYPGNDTVLFAATDAGVYGTLNGGQNWNRIGNNMRIIPVYDIDRDPFNNKLLAGTFARSMMSYPIDSIFASGIKENVISVTISVYPNPATDQITIKSERLISSPQHIYIYNAKGELVIQKLRNGKVEEHINIQNLPAGSYYLKCVADKLQGVVKFLKI